ncbi:hypothetical protein Ae706Ps2_5957 [Pseudonocardia sp. Ae706_Ps2]|nr:hypothetical protein Ae706Ps2_5957 [Pseudonocardia sp. Ae706_Ps2]
MVAVITRAVLRRVPVPPPDAGGVAPAVAVLLVATVDDP